jgi:hypothetical protein
MYTPYTAQYNWLHIKTGIRGTSTYQGESMNDLLVLINRWNEQGCGIWQYWL